MANYKTHRNIGILAAAATTTAITQTPVLIFLTNITGQNIFITEIHLLFIFLLGVIGSLLPDIDLGHSRPTKFFIILLFIIFTSISLNITEIFINNDNPVIIISALIIGGIATTIFIKQFFKYVKHRGIIHSIPFGITLTILLFETTKHEGVIMSLLISTSFFIGFITHLILDEIYSIDFHNRRIKKSFGTALKFIDKNNKKGGFILYSFIFCYSMIQLSLYFLNLNII